MWHDMFSPYLLNYTGVEKQVFKYMGNVVVNRSEIKKIFLDHKSTKLFEDLKAKIISN